MKGFQYYRPDHLEEAINLMQKYGSDARLLVGGTDLMVRLQKGHVNPLAIVDLKRVADISDAIIEADESIVVGARAVIADVASNKAIQDHFPALVEAARTVGSVQIRNRASLAGNICNASPAADTVPPLMVYDSTVELAGPDGTREVPLREFFLGPGKSVCGPAEILTQITIPKPSPPHGAAFARLTRRRGVDLASINMACRIDAGGMVVFVFGAVGPTPILSGDSSGVLADPSVSAAKRDDALRTLIALTRPISDIRAGKPYREHMLLVLARRALAQAHKRYRGANVTDTSED